MTLGVIYVVRNPKLGEAVVKVGKTSRSIEERIRELNSPTSNLGYFEPLATFPVSDIDRAESDCHSALSRFREQGNREFFSGDIKEIISIVGDVSKRYAPVAFVVDGLGGRPLDQSKGLKTVSERLLALDQAKEAQAQERLDAERQLISIAAALSDSTRLYLSKMIDDISLDGRISLEISSGDVSSISTYGTNAASLKHVREDAAIEFLVEAKIKYRQNYINQEGIPEGSKDSILRLELLMLKLDSDLRSKYCDPKYAVGNVGFALGFKVSSPEPFGFSKLAWAANEDRWVVGDELGGLSWPIRTPEDAVDRFLQTIVDCLTVDMTTYGKYYYGCCGLAWEVDNPSTTCRRCKTVLQPYSVEWSEDWDAQYN
ncbi:MAG TPA: GIY-YIG nuclease family protein [Rhizomicrobium sp.]